MTKRATFSQTEITRALKAAEAAGMQRPVIELYTDRLVVRPADELRLPIVLEKPVIQGETLDDWLKANGG